MYSWEVLRLKKQCNIGVSEKVKKKKQWNINTIAVVIKWLMKYGQLVVMIDIIV